MNWKRSLLRLLMTVTMVAVVVGLLALLLHMGQPQVGVVAFVLLLPDLLFGLVDVPASLWTVEAASSGLLPETPAPKALFQRPPPSLV